jgi:flagellum-specific ATP synthase
MQAEMAELVRLGAYRAGTDAAVDEALRLAPRIEALIAQGKDDATPLADSFARLAEALDAA